MFNKTDFNGVVEYFLKYRGFLYELKFKNMKNAQNLKVDNNTKNEEKENFKVITKKRQLSTKK